MASAIDFLRMSQDTSGGWGYLPGHSPTTEATAAVLLALRDQAQAARMLECGLGWLRATQNEDGGWGYAEGDEESGWQTAWAVLAISKILISDESYRRGVEWLTKVKPLGHRGDDFSNMESTEDTSAPVVYSWPWYPGEATWVEPTSLAILALEKESANQVVSLRVKHALTYLKQRRCPGGGWNVGNPVMFDVVLPGRAPQTALALLALLTADSNPYEEQDIKILLQDMFEDSSALGLGLGSLALRSLGIDHKEVATRIASLQLENGSWSNNNFFTGIVMMAERGTL